MQETSKYTVFNIREYLGDGSYGLGEDMLLQVLSEFSCKVNQDVERFIKKQSVEFAKKQQSVTYLVLFSAVRYKTDRFIQRRAT